ncbi:MAG TPA: hypothetical protein VGN81_06575 [Pseudonocardiaceae bacterium]|jgi:hypothetical protein
MALLDKHTARAAGGAAPDEHWQKTVEHSRAHAISSTRHQRMFVRGQDKTLTEGPVAPWTLTSGHKYFTRLFAAAAGAFGFKTTVPWRRCPHGSGTHASVVDARNPVRPAAADPAFVTAHPRGGVRHVL